MYFLRRSPLAPAAVAACLGIPLAITLSASPARALDSEVDSTTVGQSYSVTSPWGNITVKRRRFLETLALGLYHLEGGDPQPGAPEFSIRIRLRLDADAGINSEETTYAPGDDRFIPGLQTAPVDLMYGYVEGRNLANRWLGFKLGRQYIVDSLGWWSFDGGLVRVTTPVYFAVEPYGGLEQRGGFPLSTPRFERNGVWRGDRDGLSPTVYPQFEQAHIAPAYGIGLESTGVTWIHGRFDYRKVLNTGQSVVGMLVPNPVTGEYATFTGTRTSSERIGYALDASSGSLGGVKGGLVYDLYNGYFANYYGQLDWYAARGITVSGDYEYFRPTFDGDSIFNYFVHNPLTTITGRLAIDPTDQVDFAITGGIRQFTTDGDPNNFYVPAANGTLDQNRGQVHATDTLASAAGRYRYSSGLVGIRGMAEVGTTTGHRAGGDIYGEQYFVGRRWTALGRLSVYDWEDKLRPDRSATSFGYVIGGLFSPSPVAQAGLEWEHDMSKVVGQRFRVLAVLNLRVTK